MDVYFHMVMDTLALALGSYVEVLQKYRQVELLEVYPAYETNTWVSGLVAYGTMRQAAES